jgi:hypothetical protein
MEGGARIESPFHPIPIDVLFSRVCFYLSIQDLGRLMRVNRLFFETFITDQAWAHFRARVIGAMPALRERVFDKYPWESKGESKGHRDTKRAKVAPSAGARKTRAFVMPRGGVWRVMRRFVMPFTTIEGIKTMCDRGISMGNPFISSKILDRMELRRALMRIIVRFVIPKEIELHEVNFEPKNPSRWFGIRYYVANGSTFARLIFELQQNSMHTFSITMRELNHDYTYPLKASGSIILAPLRKLLLLKASDISPQANWAPILTQLN